MAKIAGDSVEQKAVFIDTNLDTHLAIPVSLNDTVFDLKRKIQSEHSKCFLKFGEIEIHALKVRRKKKDYCLSDLMPVGIVFGGVASKWFLSADVSSQAMCYDAVGYNTEFHRDRNLLMLPGPHHVSPLQRHRTNDGRNLRADNLSSDAGSGNLQMLAIINNEDNLKSSSSDTHKRLNANVDGISNGSLEKDTIPVVDSKRTGNFSGLIAEVTSVNPNEESLDMGSLGKNKVKKKKRVTANVSALGGADAVEVADVVVGGLNSNKQGDGSLEIDHLKHSSLDLKNRNILEEDRRMDPQGEEDRVFKSQNEDMPVKRSNKTKLTGKKNSKRKTKDEVADDVVSRDIGAPLSISAKSHSLPVEGSSFVNVQKNTVNGQLIGNGNNDLHQGISPDDLVLSNPQTTEKLEGSFGNNLNMDEDKPEELGKFERALDAEDRERETKIVSAVPEPRAKKSNKRKKNEDVAPNQTDAKGEGNLGVSDVGEMEEEMTRPNKRKKIWDDVLDVVKMVGIENEEPGEPIDGDNERKNKATGIALTSETTRANKRKKNEFDNASSRPPLVGEPDKLRLDEHVVPENIQTTQGDLDKKEQQIQVLNSDDDETKQPKLSQSSMIASAAKSAVRKQKAERGKNSRSEVKMRKSNKGMEDMKDRGKLGESASLFSMSGLGDEPSTVDSTEREKLLKLKSKPKISVREEDNITQSDTEPQKLIQNQKSNDTDSGNKVAKKKTKQKQASALTNISEFPVEDQNRCVKPERSESIRPPKSDALQDDEDESSSSHPECAYKGNTVAAMEAGIETKSKQGDLDDEVHSHNRGSGNGPPQEANDVNHTDAESVQLTQVQKSDNGDESKSKKSRKSKQKQSPTVKSISELPAKDGNISMKFDMGDSTRAKKAADEDEKMEPSSAFQEQTDKADSVISVKADIEIAKGAVQGEAPSIAHGVGAHIDADETRQNDADPMQLTQIQSEKNDDTKRKPKRKTKQNNTMKVERSKSTYIRSEAEKGEMESLFSPVEQVGVSPASAPQSDAVTSIAKGQIDDNISIPNHGHDINTRQEAKDASHADAEPVMLTQAQVSEGDAKPKKRNKQQLTRAGKNTPKDSQTARDDTSNGHSLEKDQKDALVKIPPNASKNVGKERTSDRTEPRESTDMGQKKRRIALLGAKRSKAASLIKPNKNDDSESSSAESDSPVKSSHQGKSKKQLPKMEQRRSGLLKSSSKSTGRVAQKPSAIRSLMSNSSSIFKDASSSSSEDKDGGNSDSSTETPNNRSSSSDSSDGESRGSWMSPKRGNLKEDGGVDSLSQSIPNKLPIASIFRSSRKFERAKVIASQLQLEDDESQPVDVVPDSQADV